MAQNTPSTRSLQRADKLVAAARSIRAHDAGEVGERGFMARILVMTTLPHSNPGNVEAWGRENGDLSLTVQPGVYMKAGQPKRIGIPYGVYPRLVLAWLTTEAVRTRSRRIVLGSSLSEFMAQIDLTPTGGRWGTITRLRDQMTRLFASRISAVYASEHSFQLRNVQIADDADLFWDPKHPNQAAVWESTVVLGERFYSEIIERPVPIDMRVLKHLTRSPMAIDLYMWLTHRMSYLKHETVIPWSSLAEQFGTDYERTKDFTYKAKQALKTIKLAWPELKYSTPRGRLVLYPCPTHVKRLSST